jgi:putative oxidoreductase
MEVEMNPPPALARAAALVRWVSARLGFLAPLLGRLFVAHAFYVTGKGKLANPESVVGFFTALGIPMPAANAWFVSNLEYYGAILLAIGLLTRPVAAMLAGTMVVALLTADKDAFLEALYVSGQTDVTGVAPLVLLVPLVWLVLHGPGLASLDALLARVLGLLPAAAPTPAPAETVAAAQ